MTQSVDDGATGRQLRVPVSMLGLLVPVVVGVLTACAAPLTHSAQPVEMGVTASAPGADGSVPTSASPGDDAADGSASVLADPQTSTTTSVDVPTTSTTAPRAARTTTTTKRSSTVARSGTAAAAGRTTGSPSPTATGPALLLGSGTEAAAEAEVVQLVNGQRQAAGCNPVTVNPILVQLARAHSQDMSGPAGFKHNSSDGLTPFQRMTDAGYDYSVAAENIAAGQPNAVAVMKAWMDSAGHAANILDCRFTEIGVGVVNRPGSAYVTYWTQEFGTPM